MDGNSKEKNDKIIRNGVHAHKLTIYDLNDDSLECIFERVPDLSHQIQIAKCSQRFHDILVGMWRRQLHHRILDLYDLRNLLENYGDIKYYLTAMRAEFHTLHLSVYDKSLNVFLKEMDNCDIHCFPCIERCEFHDFFANYHSSDSDIEGLTKLVPNLKYLQISVTISGKHLMNFQYLEELHLYDLQRKIKEIEAESLRDILLNLKHLRVLDMRSLEESSLRLTPEITQCTALEVLKLNLNTLKPMLNEVLQLPQLKQLTVLLDQPINMNPQRTPDLINNETQEFHQILQQKGPQIQGIAVNFCHLAVSSSWPTCFSYLRPENLKLLALCSIQFNVNVYSECHFARLETLCLRTTKHLQPLDILKMLHLCPVLKHLDLSFCDDLPASLLKDILNLWQKEKRQQVLCLYYIRSGFETEIRKNISYWNTQKNLKFENFPPDWDICFSYVEQGFAFYF